MGVLIQLPSQFGLKEGEKEICPEDHDDQDVLELEVEEDEMQTLFAELGNDQLVTDSIGDNVATCVNTWYRRSLIANHVKDLAHDYPVPSNCDSLKVPLNDQLTSELSVDL